jgi:hypothetical protein
MSFDIRRMSREELDEMNRQIAIHKAARGAHSPDNGNTIITKAEQGPQKAEQLDLWSGGLPS